MSNSEVAEGSAAVGLNFTDVEYMNQRRFGVLVRYICEPDKTLTVSWLSG